MIQMQHITKIFPGIAANDGISLNLKRARYMRCSERKSTLMSILFGLYEPTSGKIPVREKQTKIADPNDANRLGIDMVHQHFKLVDVFTTL